MFGPWLVAFGWLRERAPAGLAAMKPRMNFITLHCELPWLELELAMCLRAEVLTVRQTRTCSS